jgi:hypothetical protein
VESKTWVRALSLHTLIPFEDYKAILDLDDQGDTLSRYCLITTTYTIEQYCKRRLIMKRYFERTAAYGDLLLPLQEYLVRKLLAVYELGDFTWPGEMLEPELYQVIPWCCLPP